MTNPDCTTCAYAVRDMAIVQTGNAPIYCVLRGAFRKIPWRGFHIGPRPFIDQCGCPDHQPYLDHEPVRKDAKDA